MNTNPDIEQEIVEILNHFATRFSSAAEDYVKGDMTEEDYGDIEGLLTEEAKSKLLALVVDSPQKSDETCFNCGEKMFNYQGALQCFCGAVATLNQGKKEGK